MSLQGRDRDTDVEIENGLVDTVREREGGMNRQSSINMYTTMCKLDSGKLLYNAGSLAQCSVKTRWAGCGQGGVGGRLEREEIYIHTSG